MSSEKSTLSAKTSQTSFSQLSTAEKVFEQSKKNFDLKTGQASVQSSPEGSGVDMISLY